MSGAEDARQRELQRQQALLAALDSGRFSGFAPGQAPQALNVQQASPSLGLQAYRRNAQGLADRALAAAYPRLQAELGQADFAAMAWSFWRQQPPHSGDLGGWGQDLPAFLAAQPGMERELVALARLEWACHGAERAADVPADLLSLGRLAAQPERAWRARLAPGLQCVAPHQLVWRQGWRVREQDLADQPATLDFMRQLISQPTLAVALDACLARHPDFDFAAWLQQALGAGWLLGLDEATQDAQPDTAPSHESTA